MTRAGTGLLLILLATGCSTGGSGSPPAEEPPETTAASSETTGVPDETRGAPEEARDLPVDQVSSGTPGQGPESPEVFVAPSAAALSSAAGTEVLDSGDGTYLAAYWGLKSTGGHSLVVESVRLEGDRVTVRLALQEPPPDAIVTQALTYPYAIAIVRERDLLEKDFSFVDQDGQELDWPVRRVGG
ncbi:MAG: protease complex subunit PrcB family protein [Actinomycetota bacterium]|nr:protease complex subunit PrcB family protein [Actinomycetota bacterium]